MSATGRITVVMNPGPAIGYTAWRGDADLGMRTGSGFSPSQAIEDLKHQEIEAACDCFICDGRCGLEPPAMEVA